MPEVGGVSVVIMRISVVFPAPFGPSKPKISPCGSTVKLMSLTAVEIAESFDEMFDLDAIGLRLS